MAKKKKQQIPSSQKTIDQNNVAKIFGVSADTFRDSFNKVMAGENQSEKEEMIEFLLNNLDSFNQSANIVIEKYSEKQKKEIATLQTELDTKQEELNNLQQKLNLQQEKIESQQKEIDTKKTEITRDKLALDYDKENYKSEIANQKEQDYNELYKTKLGKLSNIIAERNEKIRELQDEKDSIDYSALKNQIDSLNKKNEQVRLDLENEINDKKRTEEQLETTKEQLNDLKVLTNNNNKKTVDVAIELQKNIAAELTAKIKEITEKTKEYEEAVKKLDDRLSDGDIFEGLANLEIKNTTKPEDNINNLHDFCNKFRGYAQQQKLYYDEETICTFVAGLNASHLMVLEGKSGTGKTSLPRIFANFLGNPDLTTVIPVQASWKDKHDLLGFYNEFSQKFRESDFLKALYTGLKDKNNIHIILLDEMNLSRIEYYFADFLSAMELEDLQQEISLLPGNKTSKILGNKSSIKIAKNIWFVGTANKDDSTFLITDKVYDRASVLRLDDFGKKDPDLRGIYRQCYITFDTLDKLFNSLYEKEIILEDTINKHLKNFDIIITNRTQNQINKFVSAYCACKGKNDESVITEAIDIILKNKVLRKFEMMYFDDKDKTNLENLKISLGSKYPKSAEYIGKIIEKLGQN